MENKENKLEFKIDDIVYRNQYISFLIVGLYGMYISTIDTNSGSTNVDDRIISFLGMIMFFSGIFSLFFYYKNKDKNVNFFSNRIYRDNRVVEVKLENVKEVYRVSYFFFLILNCTKKIQRIGLLGKIVFSIFSIVVLPPCLLIYLVSGILYKKIYFQNVLLIIEENDENFIYLGLPLKDLKEQEKVDSYFKKNLNIDINKLKINWYVPEK